MRKQVAQFLDHVAYERGLSENTRAAYENDLLTFVAFLESLTGLRVDQLLDRLRAAQAAPAQAMTPPAGDPGPSTPTA